MMPKGRDPLTHPTGAGGVASGAAGEALVEGDYCKARLLAMERLALLPKPGMSKIICQASETKRSDSSFMSWVLKCRSAKVKDLHTFCQDCGGFFFLVRSWSLLCVICLFMENPWYPRGKKLSVSSKDD